MAQIDNEPDGSENNDSTPLITTRSDAATPTTSNSQPTSLSQYQWYCHPGLVVLLILTTLVFLSSFISIWCLLSFVVTIVLLIEIFREFIYPLKPDFLSISFLATQFSFGAIVAPIALALIYIMLTIALSVLFFLSVAIIFGIFYALYPDAGQVLTDDLNDLDSSPVVQALHTTIHYTVPTISTVSNLYIKCTNGSHPFSIASQNMPKRDQFAQSLWDDMVNAGAPPAAIITTIVIILITAFSYVVVLGLLNTSAFEFAKWTLFVRYRTLASDPAEASQSLGVSGLVVVALTGTFGLLYMGFLETSAFMFDSSRTFYAAIIFIAAQLLDAVIFLSSQLLVASTFADISINDSSVSLPAAFRTSILATFLLGVIKVPPPTPMMNIPIFLFLTFTLLRAYGAYLLARQATAKLQTALNDQPSSI